VRLMGARRKLCRSCTMVSVQLASLLLSVGHLERLPKVGCQPCAGAVGAESRQVALLGELVRIWICWLCFERVRKRGDDETLISDLTISLRGNNCPFRFERLCP